MLERLEEVFCEVDDFCKGFQAQFEERLIGCGRGARGPESGLCDSEIITLLLVLHSSGFKYLKNFYNSPWGETLRRYFPGMPCYERFVALQKRVFMPLTLFMFSKLGKKTGSYYIDSTALPVCHNKRIRRHKTFAGLAGKIKPAIGVILAMPIFFMSEAIAAVDGIAPVTAKHIRYAKAARHAIKTHQERHVKSAGDKAAPKVSA